MSNEKRPRADAPRLAWSLSKTTWHARGSPLPRRHTAPRRRYRPGEPGAVRPRTKPPGAWGRAYSRAPSGPLLGIADTPRPGRKGEMHAYQRALGDSAALRPPQAPGVLRHDAALRCSGMTTPMTRGEHFSVAPAFTPGNRSPPLSRAAPFQGAFLFSQPASARHTHVREIMVDRWPEGNAQESPLKRAEGRLFRSVSQA